ncbi:hypothetical protein ND748_29510 [Frankia sp. AiPs1]|uniref:hypothetical protein n=1 Tax=Frankia sp. AiPs1 TaxID=573493 RepID=UPI0020439029|nr:hypothetical protein [Frankia sp. AiPs1]MCM3925797.1 hypothetical protein [Frankia sp. AiPs1]
MTADDSRPAATQATDDPKVEVPKADDSKADDWKADWQDVVDAVGRDFGDGRVWYGPDVVERGAVRRFCEPLEFAPPCTTIPRWPCGNEPPGSGAATP